jgi:hypothetical protein
MTNRGTDGRAHLSRGLRRRVARQPRGAVANVATVEEAHVGLVDMREWTEDDVESAVGPERLALLR